MTVSRNYSGMFVFFYMVFFVRDNIGTPTIFRYNERYMSLSVTSVIYMVSGSQYKHDILRLFQKFQYISRTNTSKLYPNMR
jgi:hypothetical protein